MTAAALRPRGSLSGSIASLGLPRWTVLVFAVAPVGAAVAVIVAGASTLPGVVLVSLLAIAASGLV